jgi:hypothetical protein
LTKQLCRLTVDETVVDETVVDETVSWRNLLASRKQLFHVLILMLRKWQVLKSTECYFNYFVFSTWNAQLLISEKFILSDKKTEKNLKLFYTLISIRDSAFVKFEWGSDSNFFVDNFFSKKWVSISPIREDDIPDLEQSTVVRKDGNFMWKVYDHLIETTITWIVTWLITWCNVVVVVVVERAAFRM